MKESDVFCQRYEGAMPKRRKWCLNLIVKVRRFHRRGILGAESQKKKKKVITEQIRCMRTLAGMCACVHTSSRMWHGGVARGGKEEAFWAQPQPSSSIHT